MSTVPYSMEPVHFSPQTIYCGDCRETLQKFPDNSVDLVYIDPPFNSGRTYETFWGDIQEKRAFEDRYGAVEKYITEMQPAVEQLHRVLKPTGSFYYHCDWHASHYIKVMLDQIFKPKFFLNEIIWCYKTRHFSKRYFGRKHDTIFLYSKSDNYTFNWQSVLRPLSDATVAKFKYEDENGRYRLVGRGIKGSPIRSAKDVDPKWEKTHPHLVTRSYLKEGVPIEDYWEIDIINQASKERLGYPTQKPLALLERIVSASTKPGDIVLDAFCGCGTALVAAQKYGRRWVGIDISPSACNVMGDRLERDCNLRIAPPLMSAEEIANSWNKKRCYYRFSNLPRNAAQLRALPPFEFENWAVLQLGEVLRHKGHSVFAKTNPSKVGDLGLDGKIYLVTNASLPKKVGETLFGERQPYLPVQVKHSQNEQTKVGRPVIDSFSHALERDKRSAGFVIGWDFTRDALAEIERLRKAKEQFIFPVKINKLIEETFNVELLSILGKLGMAEE